MSNSQQWALPASASAEDGQAAGALESGPESLPPHPRPATSEVVDPFAEFEGDLEDEVTRINHDHLIAEESTRLLQESEAPACLLVIGGQDLGKRFALGKGETTVGRSVDNDVILTDGSVSRRHFRVEKAAHGYHLWDLGSGNGSQVNGVRVHDAVLFDGDQIEVGQSLLRVEAPAFPRLPPGTPGFASGGWSGEPAHGVIAHFGPEVPAGSVPRAEAAGVAPAAPAMPLGYPPSGPYAGAPPPVGAGAVPSYPSPGSPELQASTAHGDGVSASTVPPAAAPGAVAEAFPVPPPGPTTPAAEAAVGSVDPKGAPHAPTSTAATKKRKSSALLVVGLIVGGLLVVGGVGAVLVVVLAKPTAAPVAVSEEELLKKGAEAMAAGDFQQARDLFEKILFYNHANKVAEAQLRDAKLYLDLQRATAAATAAMNQGKWLEVRVLAGQILNDTQGNPRPPNPFTEGAMTLHQNATAKVVEAEVLGARQALSEGAYETALQRTKAAEELLPEDPSVVALLQELTEAPPPPTGAVRAGTRTPTRAVDSRSTGRGVPDSPRSGAASRAATRANQSSATTADRRTSAVRRPSVAARPTSEPTLPAQPSVRAGATEQLVAEARRRGTQSTAGCQALRRARAGGAASDPEVSALWQQCVGFAGQLLERSQTRPPSVKRHMLHQVMNMVGSDHVLFGRAQALLASIPQDEDE